MMQDWDKKIPVFGVRMVSATAGDVVRPALAALLFTDGGSNPARINSAYRSSSQV
jgi:hypothetical protein